MKILVVGGGGREHALAWKLKKDAPQATIYAAPGNPGISEIGNCVAIRADDIPSLLKFVEDEGIDLTVVGPEAPLSAGIVDTFRTAGKAIFGPTAAAARIETSKRYSKDLMNRMGVPTAYASHHSDAESARAAVAKAGYPVVIKASGLAAGKGVIIAQTKEEADDAISSMLLDKKFGTAGDEILIEEFMVGEELSIFAICDGFTAKMMIGAQDHKRLLDGDAGPNTGGMGAYCPVSIDTYDMRAQVQSLVFDPVLKGLAEDGAPFTGLLYGGLMLTEAGPKVVEFNCRFGDPETQAILPLMDSSLLEIISTVANGGSIADSPDFQWKKGAAATTVLAAGGYPESVKNGAEILLTNGKALNSLNESSDSDIKDAIVFHAGTKLEQPDKNTNSQPRLVTAGGRVLAVTGVGETLADAVGKSLHASDSITFEGKQNRRDIGWRELTRNA